MRPEDRVRLEHMLEAAQAARKFVVGRTREDLDNDPLLRYALTYMLLVIGEAASKVDESVRKTTTGIPWQEIVGARNHLVHAYFDVDAGIIWRVAVDDLTPLIRELQSLLTS